MRTIRPLMTALGAAALLAATAVPVAAQDGEVPDLQTRLDEYVGLLPGGVAAITIKDGVTESAAAGIADADGTPFTVDTPVLLGGMATSPLWVLPLQLAEDGLLDLDEPITTYLPDAPVGDGATVRDLLTERAGLPVTPGDYMSVPLSDPERVFTTDDQVRHLGQGEIGQVGELGAGFLHTLMIVQLTEAVTGTDIETVLAERTTEPLGMTVTRRPDGDPDAIGEVAGGWIESDGEPIYLPNTSNGSRTFRPMVSSAADVATFMTALVAGEVVSPELLESTIFDESVQSVGYGFSRPDFGPMNELKYAGNGKRWFGDAYGERGYLPPHTGATSLAALSAETGDVLVVISNNHDLDATVLAADIVADWDSGTPPTAAAGIPARSALQYTPQFLCDVGQASSFDLAPCAVDEEGIHIDFHAPFESTGALDGIGSFSGIFTLRDDGSFRADSKGIFVGEVEGCGSGIIEILMADQEGFYDEDGRPEWTAASWDVVPGGTLAVRGSFEGLGPETAIVPGFTGEIELIGELACDDAAG